MAADCAFCVRIAAGEYESFSDDPDVVWFEPLNPVTPGHLLFVPVAHVASALDDPYTAAITMEIASRRARTLRAMALPGEWACNLITSSGAAATQTVQHLHVHLVPRHPGDGLRLPWTGQQGDPVIVPSLAERIDRALQDSIDRCARCRTCGNQVDAVLAELRDWLAEIGNTPMVPPTFVPVTWRTGRKVGRTIYAQAADDPSGDGVLIGVMDTAELAAEACEARNAAAGLPGLVTVSREDLSRVLAHVTPGAFRPGDAEAVDRLTEAAGEH